MSVEDCRPTLQAVSAERGAHSEQRWSDNVDIYQEDARRHWLNEVGKINYAQSTAIRHVEESGSGRVRILDASNTKPA